MTLQEFKSRVLAAFGPQMEHATPANVREFLDRIAHERWHEEKARRMSDASGGAALVIPNGPTKSYEDILRSFFADALVAADEEALIQLWTFALDMAYAGLEDQAAQQIGGLFEEISVKDSDNDHD